MSLNQPNPCTNANSVTIASDAAAGSGEVSVLSQQTTHTADPMDNDGDS